MNFVHIWGHELPCSASHLLRFTVDPIWGPDCRLVVGPTCGPCSPQDPTDSHVSLAPLVLVASMVVIINYFDLVTAGFIGTMRTLSEHSPRQYCLAATNVCHSKGMCAKLGGPPAMAAG